MKTLVFVLFCCLIAVTQAKTIAGLSFTIPVNGSDVVRQLVPTSNYTCEFATGNPLSLQRYNSSNFNTTTSGNCSLYIENEHWYYNVTASDQFIMNACIMFCYCFESQQDSDVLNIMDKIDPMSHMTYFRVRFDDDPKPLNWFVDACNSLKYTIYSYIFSYY